METIAFKKLHAEAILPTRSHEHDGGLDLYSVESFTINRGQTCTVNTGVAVAIPPGYVGQVWDRSGWALHGTTTLAGVVDSGFTGSVRVVIHHLDDDPRQIRVGDKVAQLLIVPVATPRPEWVAELPKTDRGANGFGSTDNRSGMYRGSPFAATPAPSPPAFATPADVSSWVADRAAREATGGPSGGPAAP
jgi:dUTP pyrophosphatase